MTDAEKVAAKFQGTLKKFTLRIVTKRGKVIEFQSDEELRVDFEKFREPVIMVGWTDKSAFRWADIESYETIPNTSG